MDVTLPSGAVVTLRDKVTARDKFAVQAAIRLSLDTATGLQESSGGLVNDMTNALLGQLITAWTFPWPIPSQNAENPLEELDLDDYDALVAAVQPTMLKIVGGGTPNPSGPSSS